MAELPQEILDLMKEKWLEINEKKGEPQPKRFRREEYHRCRNCDCFQCCNHVWFCKRCGIPKQTFHKLKNKEKQEREKREKEEGTCTRENKQ